MGLTYDSPSGIEDALHNGRIDIGNITFERRGTIHHWHTGEHDVVLQHHGLTLKSSAGGAFDHTLDVPGIVPVLLALRTVAWRARIIHRRQVVGNRVDYVVGGDVRAHQIDEG